jgi:photosystem II stability/assembly factor-like uncharacterized protein
MLLRLPRRLVLFVATLLVVGVAVDMPAAQVAGVVDPLDRPAMISKQAAQSVLLDIVRAGNRLVAVGERGIVLLSDDNGGTWRQAKQVPVAVTLTAVAFVSADQGWIVGHSGVVLHSVDGGETWTRQLDGQTAAALAAKGAEADAAANPNDAAAARRLEDAQRLVQDGADKPFLDLYFPDARHGFVVGAYGIIFHTEDGGSSWLPWMAKVENPQGLHFNAIAAVGKSLYIVGERGLVLRSDDDGGHFVALKTPYGGSFFAVAGDSGELVVAGLRGNAFASSDQGRSWTRLTVAPPVTLISVASLTDGRRLFVNQAGQLLAEDKGALRLVPLPPLPPLTAVVPAADGTLVGASLRGVLRLPPGR